MISVTISTLFGNYSGTAAGAAAESDRRIVGFADPGRAPIHLRSRGLRRPAFFSAFAPSNTNHDRVTAISDNYLYAARQSSPGGGGVVVSLKSSCIRNTLTPSPRLPQSALVTPPNFLFTKTMDITPSDTYILHTISANSMIPLDQGRGYTSLRTLFSPREGLSPRQLRSQRVGFRSLRP